MFYLSVCEYFYKYTLFLDCWYDNRVRELFQTSMPSSLTLFQVHILSSRTRTITVCVFSTPVLGCHHGPYYRAEIIVSENSPAGKLHPSRTQLLEVAMGRLLINGLGKCVKRVSSSEGWQNKEALLSLRCPGGSAECCRRRLSQITCLVLIQTRQLLLRKGDYSLRVWAGTCRESELCRRWALVAKTLWERDFLYFD